MKKLFPFKIDSAGTQNPHIGKIFTVGRFTVTVEDVIAEGKHIVMAKMNEFLSERGRVLPHDMSEILGNTPEVLLLLRT